VVALPYKDPEKRRAYNREWMRMYRAGEPGTPAKPASGEQAAFRVQTAKDVLALLEQVIAEVRALPGEKPEEVMAKARTIGYLAGITIRAVETADLEQRLLSLEARLDEVEKAQARRWTA
jgi:hypothetical protein